MRKLTGKRALITGSASGIGREIALQLAHQRTHLLLADRDDVGMQRTAEQARQHGVDVTTHHYDAACFESVAQLARVAEKVNGGIDLLVNNAGIAYRGPTDVMSHEEFDRLLAINLHSHIRLTQELMPTMLAKREVHILNVCSILGLVGLPKVCAYNTAKFGLVGYSESLRSEYGPQGVGVTALCPGLVRTNLFDSAMSNVKGKPKNPPRWTTTTAERVAKAAIRAIKRNRGIVVIEPLARTLFLLKRFLPGLLDFALNLGSRRQVQRRVDYWNKSHLPPEEGENQNRKSKAA